MKIFDSFRHFVGKTLVSLPARNPVRRWFEQGWAEVDADRAAFAAKHGLRLQDNDDSLFISDKTLRKQTRK